MATISATANNTSMMYQIATKNIQGTSQTGKTNYAALILGNKNNQQNSLSSLYSGSKNKEAQSYITALSENRNAYNSVLSSYNKSAATFSAEYRATVGDLKGSTAALKNTNFNVKGANEADTEANIKAAVQNVSTFVNDYNKATELFNDYAEVGKRMNNFAKLFSDNSSRESGLASIGISVNAKDGKLSVDTEKLSAAMKDSPSKVEYQLGRYGLAGKTEQKISVADSQQDKLFPSLKDMIGSDTMRMQSVYSGNSLSNMSNMQNLGNMLNIFF